MKRLRKKYLIKRIVAVVDKRQPNDKVQLTRGANLIPTEAALAAVSDRRGHAAGYGGICPLVSFPGDKLATVGALTDSGTDHDIDDHFACSLTGALKRQSSTLFKIV